MKNKRIARRLEIIVFSVFVVFFASCLNSTEPASPEIRYFLQVKGKVSVPSAFSEMVKNADSARTAMPDFSSQKMDLSVSATNDKGEKITGLFLVDANFLINLSEGEWKLEAEGKVNNETVVKGSKDKVEVTIANPILSDITINLEPVYSGGSGNIGLSIEIEDGADIKSVKPEWKLSTGNASSKMPSGDILPVSGNTVTINDSGVQAGSYVLSLYFYSEDISSGNVDTQSVLRYAVQERVNVFSGMTTSVWLGESEYLSEPGNDGKKIFKVTKDIVENWWNSTFFVGSRDDWTASDKNTGSFFAPFETLTKAVEQIKYTERKKHHSSYTIQVSGKSGDEGIICKSDFSGMNVASENPVEVTIKSFTPDTLVQVSVESGYAIKTSDNVSLNLKDLKIAGSTDVGSNDVIDISAGTLNIENSEIGGNIKYSGGELVLAGSAKLSDGKNITMSKNLAIIVKNLSAEKVAEISAEKTKTEINGFDDWNRHTKILEKAQGDSSSVKDTCRKFTLDSKKWTLAESKSDSSQGVLDSSDGHVKIKEYILEFSASPSVINSSSGGTTTPTTITVTPAVKTKDGDPDTANDSDFSDWKLVLLYQGTDTKANGSSSSPANSKTITVPADYPPGIYTLSVSVKYKGIVYGSSLKIEKK